MNNLYALDGGSYAACPTPPSADGVSSAGNPLWAERDDEEEVAMWHTKPLRIL